MLGAIAISPDGRLAATGNWDGVIKVWDIQRSTCITKIVRPGVKKPHPGTAIQSLAFSPDNQHLAATGSRCEIVYTWNPRTGTPLATFHEPEREIRSSYGHSGVKPNALALGYRFPANCVNVKK